tara:strand:+ start:2291 stop:3256 length:966 start_codon:yes stop_codon:yes gene_type:complete
MSKELKIKQYINNDYQQIYIGDFPTGVFINGAGKLKSKIITQDKDHDVTIISEDKIELSGTELITPTKITSKTDSSAGQAGSFAIECEADGDLSISNTDGDSSNNILIDSQKDIFLRADSGKLYFYDLDASKIKFKIDGDSLFFAGENSDAGDNFQITVSTNGEATLSTSHYEMSGDSTNADINIEPDGNLVLNAATDHHIKLMAAAGWTQGVADDATNVTIDFRDTQKYRLDMTGGSISGTLTLQFPAVSGNFVLLVAQDGSTRTIANYAVQDAAGSSGTLKWAGGSAPDLTDGGSKTDILSFYWDATNDVAYGVASLNF